MTSHHVVVQHGESFDDFAEDPFDDALEATFPPQRYCVTYYPKPQQPSKLRRESSTERARLYRELVGHEPYRTASKPSHAKKSDFQVSLDVKHYLPEEITLKVDGHKLLVSGKHFHQSDIGYDKSEFQRNYTIPERIDTTSLTSTITPDGILVIKAILKQAVLSTSETQEFAVLPKDESEDKFKVTLDVDGYKPADISIHVDNHHLIVTAERRDEKTDEHGAVAQHRRYERKFSLTPEVDADFLSSRYRDGKITIEAPRRKVAVEQMRKLEIKEEQE